MNSVRSGRRAGSTSASRLVSIGAALVLTAGAAVATAVPAQAATVGITILNINDFHGRIDMSNPALTTSFALAIEKLRAAGGEDNTLLLSAGDNIGASLFASAVQDDEPTLEVMDALGFSASAVGNHEFDRGFTDLTDRVQPLVQFPYLGANVYRKGTTTPALPEYTILTVSGVKVGVIGAVTQETPALVSPGGIADLDFGDPVQAVNRVAGQLSDGNQDNGEADLIVAEYHEGAATSVPPSTLDSLIAASPTFASIVNDTSPQVDAILTGHTHQSYALSAPVPGTSKTRPVLQTGSYGDRVGKIVLNVDDATGEVSSFTVENVARGTAAPTSEELASYPRVAQVKTIVDNAIGYANQIGRQPVGSVTTDITTAFSGGSYTGGSYTGGSRDDRASQSTLSRVVADALVDVLAPAERGGAQIAVVNPGGLRAELYYAGVAAEPENGDGVITYAEANSVLPFVNNLWTTTLTGAQLKTALEQQWQRDADGNVPSRPYLALGLSGNVRYTFDASRPEGDRITGIWVNGKAVAASDSFRVGSFSFLLQGGDNFRVFTEGTDTRDSGLIDRDGWISYLQAHPKLAPSFAKAGVEVTGVPASAVTPGGQLSFTVSGLNLTSLGSPANTSLSLSWGGSKAKFGTVTVTDGSATVSVVVPKDAPAASVLTLTAAPSGTTVTVPVTVKVSNAIKNLKPPTIKGVARPGHHVVATPGTWSPSKHLTFRYDFKLNGKLAKSTSVPRFTVGKGDLGKALTVTVTASAKGLTSASATSAPVIVTKGTVKHPARVTIKGHVAVGHRLTLNDRGWQKGATFSYTWKLDGKVVSTKPSYTPDRKAAGKKLTLTVTARAKGYTPVTLTSKPARVATR
ncbi:MAG: bifunctional UDP-sugar hydrolase/5'-nucleotidase [Propionicimonas sp.]|uniref:bifunctional metallophosphatase/5'-nucleotidase n=1 Tax=Propionicimonas sp. TaxID=1955623 RepID=UPI002B1FE416|nr:bifunctional UDP-sugar hydrolase/5'-nucleotidase [Propionicimonas sp.]MEA4943345.1 bifunctional UDP-sugar hydrolase/5'-nucleotidase [Propionicimonas sp.]